jgi:hypothetical protein
MRKSKGIIILLHIPLKSFKIHLYSEYSYFYSILKIGMGLQECLKIMLNLKILLKMNNQSNNNYSFKNSCLVLLIILLTFLENH